MPLELVSSCGVQPAKVDRATRANRGARRRMMGLLCLWSSGPAFGFHRGKRANYTAAPGGGSTRLPPAPTPLIDRTQRRQVMRAYAISMSLAVLLAGVVLAADRFEDKKLGISLEPPS